MKNNNNYGKIKTCNPTVKIYELKTKLSTECEVDFPMDT